nr:RNA-directed DNA polymerase, eukaryota [Tanacetum cinerariifolium]
MIVLDFIKTSRVFVRCSGRLVGNLCTLCIGRMHLHANIVRFERSPIHSSRPTNPIRSDNTLAPLFASALKGNPNISFPISSSRAMVLDDSCVVKRDLDNYVMGKVKQFSSINNLHVLLSNEGFQNVKLAYLGGLWVMIELESSKTKTKFMQHVGVASWLVAYAMPNRTLSLGNGSFGLTLRVYLCTLGHALLLIRSGLDGERAKELFVWSPVFKDVVKVVYCSDDESVKGADENNVETSKQVILDAESDVEGVLETYFGEHDDNLGNDQDLIQPLNEKETSNNPFNIYDLLKKHDKGEVFYGRMYERYGEHYWIARSSRCFPMNCLSLNIQGLGSKAKKEWIKELNIKYKLNFLTLQETKMDSISAMDVKLLWGNYNFDHVFSEAVGNSGSILCTWDSNIFHKEQHIISKCFVALYGTWNSNKAKLLMISMYAPQSATGKRSLWSYITSLITRWNGDCMVMGDFNKVRCMEDRMGSVFNVQGANEFNNFISNSGLVEVQLEGYSFTWSHPSATKMSKLDRFTEGLVSLFPYISGIFLDRHLSDHRPILLREVITDYGAMPFRMYHSWFSLHGFEQMVTHTWNSIVLDDRNGMVRFKKKMQFLKKEIRVWVIDQKQKQSGRIKKIKSKLTDIDKLLDQGGVNDEILLSHMDLLKQMQDIKSSDSRDCMQKAKIQWAIEGDENSKFFHCIINRKRANLAIKGVMVDGEWMDDPSRFKEEFRSHFATRFQAPGVNRSRLNFRFPNRLNPDQVAELENPITRDEIRNVVWACGENIRLGQTDLLLNFSVSFGILLDQTCLLRLNGSLIIARSQRAVIHLSLL